VIPAYNAEEFIAAAVRSVFDQTYRPLEIIVVNDGSTDSTVDVVRSLSGATPEETELRIIDFGENRGAANALNIGFSSASGEYICWLSADDMFLDRKKVQMQVEQMVKENALWSYFRDFYTGLTVSEATLIKTQYLPRFRALDGLFVRSSHLRFMMLLFRNPINGSSIMIRRDCIERCGQFDPYLRSVDADGDLWMRYSALGVKVASIKGAPIFYRTHPGQVSRSTSEMSYGSELTRLRILAALRRMGRLSEFVTEFIPFIFVLFETTQHLSRPLVSEFLCNFIIENYGNRILLTYARRSLDRVQRLIDTWGIDRNKLSEDLQGISTSPVFKDFERKLMK